MSLGQTPKHQDLFQSSTAFCAARIAEGSIYGLLHRDGHRLFPDAEFADLFQKVGRDSVPPQIVAVAMVLPTRCATRCDPAGRGGPTQRRRQLRN